MAVSPSFAANAQGTGNGWAWGHGNGQGGDSVVAVVDPSDGNTTCAIDFSPSSGQIPSDGTTSMDLNVYIDDNCQWTATTGGSDWIFINHGQSGVGQGYINYAVSPNTAPGTRVGYIYVNDSAFLIEQAGQSCSYEISPAQSDPHPATAVTGQTFQVLTSSDCVWQAVSDNPSWITVSNEAGAATDGGVGSGTVYYDVAANDSPNPRTGTITVADKKFTVVQDGAECNFSLDPSETPVLKYDGFDHFTVNVVASGHTCAWSIGADVPDWITITEPSSYAGVGDGVVRFNVAANPAKEPRQAMLLIGGKEFLVKQGGAICNFDIQPTESDSLSAQGAQGVSFNVYASDVNCPWGFSNRNPEWITVIKPEQGTQGMGNGQVVFDVAPNTDVNPRYGIIDVEGLVYTVRQEGAVCNYQLIPSQSDTIPAIGVESLTFSVQATGEACSWKVVSENPSWIEVLSPTTGEGTGTANVEIRVLANTTPAARQGMVTVEDQVFTVNQAAGSCTYTVDPEQTDFFTDTGGLGEINVVASNDSCAWEASTTEDWISIDTASGTGTGQVVFTVGENMSANPRTGIMTVAGKDVSVRQRGKSCNYEIDPSESRLIPSSGSNGEAINVTATAGECPWNVTVDADWVTIVQPTGGSSTGSGVILYTVAPNTSSEPRQATVDVVGQVFTVRQAGAQCNYQIDPAEFGPVEADGASSLVLNVTATSDSCTWNATSGNPSWIVITSPAGGQGMGSGQLTFDVKANTSINPRSGTMTVMGQTVKVTQNGAVCSYELSASGSELIEAGGQTALGFGVTAASAECAWTVENGGASWITVTSPGQEGHTGSGTVTFDVAANSSPKPRQADLTVGGQTYTVKQAGGDCNYTVSPSSSGLLDAQGGQFTFDVATTSQDCTWEVLNNDASWITIISPSDKSSGDGSVTYRVAANTTPGQRTGTIGVEGQVFTVTQSGGTCSYSVSPSSPSTVQASGGTGFTLSVTASDATCPWTAVSSDSWITVLLPSGGQGTGSGTVTYNVAENTGTSSRQGSISVAGQTVTIRQEGGVCSYDVVPRETQLIDAAGTTGITLTVSASSSSCQWSASSNDSWITITQPGGGSGSGDGRVVFNVAENTGSDQRQGSVTVAGLVVVVTQAGKGQQDIELSDSKLNLVATKTGAPYSVRFAIISGDGPFTLEAEDGGEVSPSVMAEPGVAEYTYFVPDGATETISDTILVKDVHGNKAKLPVTISISAVADIPGLKPDEQSLGQAVGPAYSSLERLEEQGGELSPAQSDLKDLLGEMIDSDDPTAVSGALGAITPDGIGGGQRMTKDTGQVQAQNLTKRLSALRGGSSGVSIQGLSFNYGGEAIPMAQFQPLVDESFRGGSAGEEEQRFLDGRLGIFVSGQLNFGDKSSTDEVDGFSFDTKGVTVGVDYWFTETLVLGIAGGYARTDMKYDSKGKMDLDGYNVALYGNWYIWDNLYLDGLVGYGFNNYDSRRTITYQIDEEVDRDVKADYDGNQATFSLGLGYDYAVSGWNLGARGRVTYMPYSIDAFTEKADSSDQSDHGLDLHVSKLNDYSLTTTLGGTVSYAISTPACVIIPRLGLDWEHEFGNNKDTIDVGFANAPTSDTFSVFTDNPDRNYFHVTPGLTFVFPRGITLFGTYEATLGKKHFTEHAVNFGVRVEF